MKHRITTLQILPALISAVLIVAFILAAIVPCLITGILGSIVIGACA
jgi:hypothetical protein